MIEILIVLLIAKPVSSVVIFWLVLMAGLAIVPAGIATDRGRNGWLYWLVSAVSIIAGIVLVLRLSSRKPAR